MAASVITPNPPNVDGLNMLTWVTTDTDDPDTVTLATDDPSIDLRIENPVISMAFFDTTADANSEVYDTSTQDKRAATSDQATHWAIATARTILIKKTNAEAGFVAISYIAYGNQMQ